MSTDVFSPIGPSVNLSVVTSSTSVAVTPMGQADGAEIRIANVGTAIAYVAFGDSAVTATATSMAILPSTAESFGMSGAATHVAAITVSGSTTLNITTGRGV